MTLLICILTGFLKRQVFVTLCIVFQVSIIPVFANAINLGLNPHSSISETYTYDETESSVRVEGRHSDRVNWEISKKEVGANDEVFVGESSVAARGSTTVYTSASKGVTQYVGITNNLARRSAEHLASKGINIQPLMKGLSRTDARAVEQALIEIHGLGKNGGTLLNRINSISPKNPAYGSQLQRGYDLLKSIGY